MKTDINIGVVADWFITYAGSEKVVAEFLSLFPKCELYAVVDFLSQENKLHFQNKVITTTFIQNLPKARTKYQSYLPFMPLAIETSLMSLSMM